MKSFSLQLFRICILGYNYKKVMNMNEFEKLKRDILTCQACQGIIPYAPRPIFQGQQDSFIMQISQAPSRKVMETGLPFNDVSGEKLRNEWYQITSEQFYNPQYFYITSIGRCFPGKAKTGDNTPSFQCAQRFLKKELEVVQPQIYILIGSYAAKFFYPDLTLEELIFNDHNYLGKPLFVLPHPSPLNRKWLKDHPDFENKRIIEIRKQIHHILQQSQTFSIDSD